MAAKKDDKEKNDSGVIASNRKAIFNTSRILPSLLRNSLPERFIGRGFSFSSGGVNATYSHGAIPDRSAVF